MRYLSILVLVLFGCGSENINHGESPNKLEEVWVCHNPASELHDMPCVEETTIYRGHHQPCYWVDHKKVKNSYCWLLTKEDCENINMEWQESTCSLLNM